MQMLIRGRVRIAIVFGSQWIIPSEGAFLCLVRKCLSAFRQCRTLNCFFCWWSADLFQIGRTENVDPWPSFNTQLNYGVSSNFSGDEYITTALIFVVTGFVCVHKYARTLHVQPLFGFVV